MMTKFSYHNKPLGIYIHIPFCQKKCAYCDFYSITDMSLCKAFVTALLGHIRAYGKVCRGYTVDTIYIGGGTPTCLGAKLLGRILQQVRGSFTLDPRAEWTVECNPESTDKKILDCMRKNGVNRLSFGVQSAHEDELKRLGRIHSFETAQKAVQLARARGFSNIGLDLMYALPEQTQAQLLDSVAQCLALEPTHLSCYGLTLEPNTPMGRAHPTLPDEDVQADAYLAMCKALREAGYEHYEVSNFAKPGYRSRHNQKYWDLSEYIGMGPSAHSLINGKRFFFARDLSAYIAGENMLAEEEEIPGFERQAEYLMLRLRTSDGVDLTELEKRYNVSSEPYEEALRALLGNGWVTHHGTCWALTETGFLISSSIIHHVLEAGYQTIP